MSKVLPRCAAFLLAVAGVFLCGFQGQPPASGSPWAANAAEPAALYVGPLFSVHEHFGSKDLGRTVEGDAEFFAGVVAQEGMNRVVAFVPTRLTQRPGPGEQQIRAATQVFPDRFLPFWYVLPGDFFQAPDGLRQVFAEGPFWVGTGEWPLYGRNEYRPGQTITPPDDAILLQVYDVVAEFDRTVMVHPHYGRAALERALGHNQRTPFLIHGTQAATQRPPCLPAPQPLKCMDVTVLTELMQVHSNFFFDVSATANPHVLEEHVDGVDRKTHLHGDLDAHVEEAFRFFGDAFEAFPDRFLIGWDTGNLGADYDLEYVALGVEFYRKLLGRLKPATAEKIAYRNAERVVLRIPTIEGPPAGASLSTLGTTVSWLNPPNTTQYQLQVLPVNNDGPAINLIIGDPTIVNESAFTIPPPVLGQGPYVMLPDMTYTWRVRTAAASTAIDENSPQWRPWSESRTFRTPTRASATISVVQPPQGGTVPASGATLGWSNRAQDVFYYEVQVSPDLNFGEAGPVASVWHNLVHGGVSTPLNSWTTPNLEPGTTYFWRVRPRVQGDGTPVAWSATWSFLAQ